MSQHVPELVTETVSQPAVPALPAPQRLMSIDALRGFDMFWIVGGDALILSLLALVDRPWAQSLALQWKHVEWEGFRFYDLIFPLFLFLVGCVLPYSLEKHRDRPMGAYMRIARRVALLLVLGLIANGILKLQFENLRLAGVLQRIGICYGIVALLFLHLNVRALVGCLSDRSCSTGASWHGYHHRAASLVTLPKKAAWQAISIACTCLADCIMATVITKAYSRRLVPCARR